MTLHEVENCHKIISMKIAIIGASTGQLPLCHKAKESGFETICFAWPQNAICKNHVDRFYPISILEKDIILEICREEKIVGVVSNGSDLTAEVASYISTKLDLHGIDYESFLQIKDKSKVRFLTRDINELSQVRTFSFNEDSEYPFPCVVKPKIGSAKKGVSYVQNKSELDRVAKELGTYSVDDIMIEEYIEGHEVSVETLSFESNHYVIQITDKENSGTPHFVELSHHQPSQLPETIKEKIKRIVPSLLNTIGVANGATHIEMKIKDENVFLIEINPRGGGGEISNRLVELSTGFDYITAMINVAVGMFTPPVVKNTHYAGIYFICLQTKDRLPFFLKLDNQDWLVEKCFDANRPLTEATGNHDRNGYFIYQSSHKVTIQ